MTISITKMKVINISHLLDIPPTKLMILIGDEFYNRFDSLESMVEFANSNEVFIQCVFIDDIKSVSDFSSVKSDYVIQPYFIKVVDKSKK